MATILESKSIYYNDVNLIARPAVITSRDQVPKELGRIMVAPMEAVVGETFAIEANRLGLTVCLHKFCEVERQISIFSKLDKRNNVFVSVGINDFKRVKALGDAGVTNFLIDVANGYLPNLKAFVASMKCLTQIDRIMLGNVMTGTGFYNAVICDIDTYVRVGIAGGSACSTSDATGYNRGQITEIMEVSKTRNTMGYTGFSKLIVADGGIKNGNYAAKAFGAGADCVMMGGYFANAVQAETHVIGDGTYWGGASCKQQSRWGGIKRHSEGKVYKVDGDLYSLEFLVDNLWGGIASAVSYSGYATLSEFIDNGVFEIKQNSLPPKR